MKNFNDPEIKLYPLVVKDRLTNEFGAEDEMSDVLPEDEFDP